MINVLSSLCKKIVSFISLFILVAYMTGVSALPVFAQSSVASIQGANIQSTSPTDFASASFYQSLQNLRADGANSVSLVIPLTQSNIWSTDVRTTSNTPTDASLVSAITKAHALGMSVTLKPHVDSQDWQWRAFIDPSDRATWFANYSSLIQHYATIAQKNEVEQFVIGTELLNMSSGTHTASNTTYWETLIKNMRSVYSGKLGYAANWGPAGTNLDEKNQIAFWKDLDFAGIDAYYPLASSNDADSSVAALVSGLGQSDIPAFEQKTSLPIEIMEVGYRSANGILTAPGDSSVGYGVNDTLQANAYQALFSYLSGMSYIHGIYIWEWKSNPYAGGASDSDYTPQGKPAETVMKTWYTGAGDPTEGSPTSALQSLQASVTLSGTSGALNVPVTVTSQVQNTASYAQTNLLVDTEIYDQNGTKVFQNFSDNQAVDANQTKSYQVSWTPTHEGIYTAKIGVFAINWSTNILWNGQAASFSTAGASEPIATSTTPVATTTPSTPPTPPAFTVTADPLATSVSTPKTLTATVTDTGGASTNLVDLELYDANGNRLVQNFTPTVSFTPGEGMQFTLTFTPTVSGTYRLAVGVFSTDWSKNFVWTNQAALLTASTSAPTIPVATTTPVTPTQPVSTTTATTTPITPPIATSTTPVATTTPTIPVVPVTPVTPAPVVTSTGTIYPAMSTARAGTSADFAGKNFGHEETVVITSVNGKVGQSHADGGGNFSTGSLALPSTPGIYTFTFTGQVSGVVGTAIVTVTS